MSLPFPHRHMPDDSQEAFVSDLLSSAIRLRDKSPNVAEVFIIAANELLDMRAKVRALNEQIASLSRGLVVTGFPAPDTSDTSSRTAGETTIGRAGNNSPKNHTPPQPRPTGDPQASASQGSAAGSFQPVL